MDTNAQVQIKKPRRRFWTCLVVGFVILVILVCGLFSVFGYLYLNSDGKSSFKDWLNQTTKNSNSNNNNSNPTGSTNDVTSGDVFQAQGTIINIVEKASPAVVTVIVKEPKNPQNNSANLEQRQSIASGTGFFITEDGTLITNEHVVCGATADDLLIVTSDQKNYSVNSLAVDSAQDVAILRVNTNNDKVSSLKFANPNSVIKTGQEVLAIGNPFGDNPGSVSQGIISGVGRNISATGACSSSQNTSKDYEGVFQTDAAINSGNSGGPLLNMNGEVIGVNSATLRGANNISYTVPFTTVLKTLDRYYKNNNKIISPFIGVTHQIIDPSEASANGLPAGALVLSVQAGSPADKAGVKKGDIITKIGDKSLSFSLVATLNQFFEPNQKTTLEVFRPDSPNSTKGKTMTLDITIGTRAEE